MATILGIDFAPLNVPFERRLQAAVLSFAVFVGLVGPIISPLLYFYILFSKYYFIAILYAIWMWYDYDTPFLGGRRTRYLHLVTLWHYAREYFPMRILKTTDLDPNRNYIFSCHPHGQICAGPFLSVGYAMLTPLFPGFRPVGLTLSSHFFLPFYREIALFAGTCSVSKRSINYLLNKCGKGIGVIVVPGGSAEAMEAHPGMAVTLLKNRKGFIRLAIENGVSVIPVYTFGETDLYYQWPNPEGSFVRNVQAAFKDIFSIPLYLINGRGLFQYTFGILPRRTPLITVVGAPIDIEKHENPTEEIVNKYHAKYMESLQQLFDEYKVKIGGDFAKQELVFK